MRYRIALIICFTLRSPAYAQQLYFGGLVGTGVSSGFPLTDYTTQADSFGNPASHFQFRDGSRSLILAVTLEARLSGDFSFEADALRRPMNSTILFTQFPLGAAGSTTINHFTAVVAWEFPLLLKYALPSTKLPGPFVMAGPAFRAQQNASGTELSQAGVSGGAGLAFDLGRVRIAPQLRYTRWADHDISPKYATRPDQVEFLTTIAFRTERASRHLAGRKIEIGGLAGLPLTRALGPLYDMPVPERTRYLAGVVTQFSLTSRISIEVNGIYKPLRAGRSSLDRFSVLTWEVPALAKYCLGDHGPAWRPFIEGGPSFRLAGNLNGYNPSHYGVTAGAGIARYFREVGISPALRYARWAKDAPPSWFPASVHNYARTNPNAVELVLGVNF